MTAPERTPRVARHAAALLAGYALAGAIVTLAGWALRIPRLTDWDLDGIAQMPNNAVAVLAVAAGLLCLAWAQPGCARALGVFAMSIAIATLFEHATGIDLGIDTLLIDPTWGQRGATAPGRMGLPGAMSVVLIGLSIVFTTYQRTRRAAIAGGILAMSIATLSLIGYAFSADPLYAIPKYTGIALQTSTMLFALGASVAALIPERSPMRILLGDTSAALLARRALPLVVIAPIAVAWMAIRGQRAGLFDAAFGTALLVLVLIELLAALVLWSADAIFVREMAIRESRDRLALLFNKAAYPAVLATLPEGTYIDVNDAFTRLFGYSREEAIGRTSFELGILRDASQRSQLTGEIAGDGDVAEREMILFTRSGDQRIVVNNATVIEIAGRKHLLSMLQDVTERKAAEESLRRSTEALLAADRMKDEFLATLSHELRTPLTAIVGWSDMLLKSQLDAPQQKVALEAIGSSAKAQAQLVEDVLDVSRIITGKMRIARHETDLATVIENAVSTVRPAAEAKNISVRVNVDSSLPRMFIDAERMQQVVWNLLSNAIKFSPKGSPVDVSARAESDTIVIEVTDRGYGIASDFLPHLFERFRQADSSATRKHGGLGIGLALAKDLVELHGGTIACESEEGRGSRFTVRLPRPSAADATSTNVARAGVHAALHGVRVLYVDDREDARLLVGTMLKQHGAQVVEAGSVDDALTVLTNETPDVVVTDLAMPQRDGYDLLALMRANRRWATLPVLALTAQGRADDEARAFTAGFRSFLRKPIESADLAAAVARALQMPAPR